MCVLFSICYSATVLQLEIYYLEGQLEIYIYIYIYYNIYKYKYKFGKSIAKIITVAL